MLFFSSLLWPNLDEIESTAKQVSVPLPPTSSKTSLGVEGGNDGSDTSNTTPRVVVTVYGFEKNPGDYPSYFNGCVDSPYVARVEAFCRLHSIEYVKEKAKPFENKRTHKLPFITINASGGSNDNILVVDDSSKVIQALIEQFNLQQEPKEQEVDIELDVQTKLIQKLLFGSLYYVLLHHMFETNEGRQEFVKYKSKNLPTILSYVILNSIFHSQREVLKGSGFGRLTHNEIVNIGKEDLMVLSQILGDKKFMLSDQSPTNIDADVYAFVATCLWDNCVGNVHSWINEYTTKHCSNLIDYMNRMKFLLYPELCGDSNKTTN